MVSNDSQAGLLVLKQVIEAILYLKGEPLDLASLAQFAQCQKEEAYKAVQALIQDYAERDSALEVLALDKRFALQLRRPFSRLVNQVFPPELGVGALRTLATIVLKGPLSQSDLVDLRGPSAYAQVAELVEKGFVVKYRRQGVRSLWVKVTDKVERYFTIDELATADIDGVSAPLTTSD
jgi:segregation and condensation protein B